MDVILPLCRLRQQADGGDRQICGDCPCSIITAGTACYCIEPTLIPSKILYVSLLCRSHAQTGDEDRQYCGACEALRQQYSWSCLGLLLLLLLLLLLVLLLLLLLVHRRQTLGLQAAFQTGLILSLALTHRLIENTRYCDVWYAGPGLRQKMMAGSSVGLVLPCCSSTAGIASACWCC